MNRFSVKKDLKILNENVKKLRKKKKEDKYFLFNFKIIDCMKLGVS